MRLSPLNRLRLSFLGIGALLLLPLALLAHAVTARLEAQRRLRHEVVAERIFDEVERELTVVLSQEFARPSSAYDAASVGVEPAPAYVLGYFTSVEGHSNSLGPKHGDERDQRLAWALGEWDGRHADPYGQPVPIRPAPPSPAKRQQRPAAPAMGSGAPKAPAPRSSPDILRQLNRGDLERQEYGY